MGYSVIEVETPARPTAVIAEVTTWDEFSALWPRLLDEVWAAVRSRDEIEPNRNVMLYKDDLPNVEVGVEVAGPFHGLGRVVSLSLPAGRAVTTTHRGRYEDLGLAHEAIVEWCDGHGLRRLGPCWEIYDHWRKGSADQEVEIYHLVR